MAPPPDRRPWMWAGALLIIALAIFFLFRGFLDGGSPVNADPPRDTATNNAARVSQTTD